MTFRKTIAISLVLLVIKTIPAWSLQQSDSVQHAEAWFRSTVRWRIDSLKQALETLPEDSAKVMTLLECASAMHIFSLDSAHGFVMQAKKLAEALHFPRGEINVFTRLGGIYQEKKNYAKAISLYRRGYEIAEQYDLYNEIHAGYCQILNLYFYLGEFAEAMKVSTKGLALGDKLNSPKLEAYYVNLIGFIYLHQHNTVQAEKYYNTYLELGKHIKDSVVIADAFSNLAEVYTAKQDHDKALRFLFQALNLYQRLYIKKELMKSDRLPYTYFKIGCAYKAQRNFKEALVYCLRAIDYMQYIPSNKYDIASYYIYTGDVYKELGNFKKAIPFLRSGLLLAKQIRHRENARDAYAFLAQTYDRCKRYDSAYHFQKLYTELADSIVNEQSRREVEQIMGIYSLEKKDREIGTLKQQKQLSEAEAERQRIARNAVIIIMILFLILFYLLYNRYRLQQKNRFQQELNFQQNRMFNAIATLQDQERKRIAQDIHDTLGSILSTAKLRLSGMEEFSGSMHPQQQEHYNAVITLLDEAVSELRNISHNIMPATLSRLGLVAALQNLFDKISSCSEIRIHYNVHGITSRLDESAEIMIYRIVLELVNNIVKHAGASNVTVQLIRYTDHINATVEDDGAGFDFELIKRQNQGIGLSNIVSRIEYLKGKIEIDTGLGQGTSIVMDIPLPAK